MWPVPFEVLYALAELVVGKMNESPCFAKLLGDGGLILRVSDIDEGIEAFGQELHFMAKPFHQHAAVALDLFDPIIHFVEAPI